MKWSPTSIFDRRAYSPEKLVIGETKRLLQHYRRKADVQPDDRCARNFMPAICIAATVIFWL